MSNLTALYSISFSNKKILSTQSTYTSIVPLLDSYTEAYQGKYGLIKDYKLNKPFSENPKTMIKYFNDLLVEIKRLNIPDQYLQNII